MATHRLELPELPCLQNPLSPVELSRVSGAILTTVHPTDAEGGMVEREREKVGSCMGLWDLLDTMCICVCMSVNISYRKFNMFSIRFTLKLH